MLKKFLTVTMSALLLFIGSAGIANASKTVWEEDEKKLELLGDLRFRYEIDNNDSKSGDFSPERTRERIRLRFGGIYHASDHIEAGFRLATGSNDLHSPHQTLSDGADERKKLSNTNFGTDKGYIKYHRGGWWAWAGKNSLPAKQLTNTWWEGDFNPGGLAIGYSAEYGDSKSGISMARLTIRNNDHKAINDYGVILGADYQTEISKLGLKFTLARLTVAEATRDINIVTKVEEIAGIPGGNASYNYLGTEGKIGKFALGTELFLSDVVEGERGGASATEEDLLGIVGYLKVKINKTFGVRYYYYDIGYGSVPLLGLYAQDDFPLSSNFTGSKIQIDVDTGIGMKIDIRYYTQETKNETISVNTNSTAMKGKNKATRTQLNFNVPF